MKRLPAIARRHLCAAENDLARCTLIPSQTQIWLASAAHHIAAASAAINHQARKLSECAANAGAELRRGAP